MGTRIVRALACALSATIVIGSQAVAGPSPAFRARKAARYVVSQQMEDGSIRAFSDVASTSDAIVSLVAARRGPHAIDDAVRYLRENIALADKIGEKAKVVMALVAAGRNPRRFAGENLVGAIKSSLEADGSYGDLEQSEVFDQALSILALVAAEARVRMIALDWLVDAQCGDGGWQFDAPASIDDDASCKSTLPENDFIFSDTNTTAYAVMALNARPWSIVLKADPFEFFGSARDPHFGGWVYDPTNICTEPDESGFCYRTDTNSTALTLQAHAAAGVDPPPGSRRALRRLQLRLCGPNAGAFAFTYELSDGDVVKGDPNLGATIQAIPGLLERPFPIGFAEVTKPPPPKSCNR
ncbi:MAG: terpene cyclase/mutase family protein [Actinomycetota bacterium]|nr:terpene cyclase/mutase family protein [Actinomycetota bacterium]